MKEELKENGFRHSISRSFFSFCFFFVCWFVRVWFYIDLVKSTTVPKVCESERKRREREREREIITWRFLGSLHPISIQFSRWFTYFYSKHMTRFYFILSQSIYTEIPFFSALPLYLSRVLVIVVDVVVCCCSDRCSCKTCAQIRCCSLLLFFFVPVSNNYARTRLSEICEIALWMCSFSCFLFMCVWPSKYKKNRKKRAHTNFSFWHFLLKAKKSALLQ